MKVTQPKSFDNEVKTPNVPEGVHKAVIYSIVDLGTQKLTGDYGDQEKRQIRITWEIPGVRKIFKEGEDAKPCVLSKKFTLSMHEKANLRAVAEQMLDKKFESEDEAYDFDTNSLIGKTCLLFVEHNKTKEYANIKTVMKNTDGIELEPENATVIFDLEEADWTIYEGLGKWIKEEIEKSPEFKAKQEKQDYDDTDDLPF